MHSDRPLGDQRVLVVGAGALGSLYGAVLARGGASVQLLARETHARAVSAQGGLQVLNDEQDWFSPLEAVSTPSAVVPADVVVMMAKTPDTGSALAGLEHVRGSVRLAVSWQNGLAKDTALADWFGPDPVVGGASMVGAVPAGPGAVHHTFTGPTFVGELPVGRSPRTGALAALLEAGGLPAVDTEDVRSVEWSKLVQVLPAMSLTALTRLPYHAVLCSPRLSLVFARLVAETAAVAAADGVAVADWPGMLPVATLSALPEKQAAERVRVFGQKLVKAGQTSIRPSMLQSIERGRRLEVDAVQGHVVDTAARLGIEVPTVALCHQLLAGIDATLS